MNTILALASRILDAGATSLDRYNPCAQHGAERGEPCMDDEQRAVYCTQRVSGDPILTYVLRDMARECRVIRSES